MIKWIYKMHQLPFSQLMNIYAEGNLEKAREEYGQYPMDAGLQMAEQDFYQYLQEIFFSTKGACYAVWMEDGVCLSALRLEPYRDGLLLAALETAPEQRRKGFGRKLVQGVLEEMSGKKIYSHVDKSNLPSLMLHESCGFVRTKEIAVYLDGSVNDRCCTFLYEKACI